MNPLQETRIDMPTVTRAVVEGIRQYKKQESSWCVSVLAYCGIGGMLITLLVFNASMIKSLAAIENKLGV
jgi:hypothetical protein